MSVAGRLLLRGDDYSRWLTARETLHAGTLAGGRALGFGDALGSLRVGALADLVGYRLDTVSFTPLTDPVRQLVYAERGAGVRFAMVGGRPVMQDGRLSGIDEAAILDEIESEYRGLADRYAAAEASSAPVIDAVATIYRRSLASAIAPDTHRARL